MDRLLRFVAPVALINAIAIRRQPEQRMNCVTAVTNWSFVVNLECVLLLY